MALPVSLDQAKAQLRVDGDDQDVEIGDFIRDAAGWVEEYTGHILEARDVEETFYDFRPVALKAWPISADAEPVLTFSDAEGVTHTVPVSIDVTVRPARVFPDAGNYFPFGSRRQQFSVQFRAGYEDPDDVPGNICRAMLILIGAYDADREGGETLQKAETTARRLCRRLKRHTL
ncbi:hypothetical protein LH128_05820 [Sphingomonas sp. LH128]|uniref:phage head-tail connector protein n=1 Tax=Sphingomonas sp. LH128 TaxID=473781 RepID=UPI00027CA6DB|nr:phage head-tail connector protein [Sphingomonas sp. LH128]EJU13992.1 hypothetical protein LH128_05820 [Sphingomonas sp. LH128]